MKTLKTATAILLMAAILGSCSQQTNGKLVCRPKTDMSSSSPPV